LDLFSYEVFKKIKKYYNDNCKSLIFVGEKLLSQNNKCKMYFCDVDLNQEKENYRKVFQEYLALYVRNYDLLKYYDKIKESETEEEISKALIYYGNDLWNNTVLLTTTTPETLGIYGEALNDFYLNIVKNENILITYSTKRGYGERNIKGVDIVACNWKNDNLVLIFSECKFVESIYKASNGLYNDIKGTQYELAHISKDYINGYSTYIVDNAHSIFAENDNLDKIIDTLDKLNSKVINGCKAIDAFNELNIKIQFNFFAIYYDDKYIPDERKIMFEKVYNAFNENVKLTGIKNYDMEIVYIPIKNTSSVVKEYMRKWN